MINEYIISYCSFNFSLKIPKNQLASTTLRSGDKMLVGNAARMVRDLKNEGVVVIGK